MKIIFHLINITFFIFISFFSAVGQVVISNATITNQSISAPNEIIVQPNSNVTATSGNESHLYIDKNIQVPVPYQSSVNYSSFTVPPIDFNLPVGTISGNGGVSPDGQASYDIPLIVPPGTRGVSPTLGISYNSSSPDGILGRGWNLRGLSAITRVPKDFYHDNKKAGIALDDLNDVYALDGVRLINTGGNIYRLENENFSLVTLSGGFFKVETKDGMTMEYGNITDSPNSQLILTNPFNSQNKPLGWYLSKAYDRYGNYILYSYNNQNGEVTIKEISYTGNSNAGILPYNSVKFYYDKRADLTTRYLLNNSLPSSLLLREIEIKCEENFMKRYLFKYGYNSQTFLNEVTEQGNDYSKLNSTFIQYGGNFIPLPVSITTPSGLVTSADYVAGDFNADGKSDLLAFTFNALFSNGTRNYTGWELYLNLNNGASFNHIPNSSLPALPSNFFPYSLTDFLNESSYTPPSPIGMQTADFNCDGKDDILIANTFGGVTTY